METDSIAAFFSVLSFVASSIYSQNIPIGIEWQVMKCLLGHLLFICLLLLPFHSSKLDAVVVKDEEAAANDDDIVQTALGKVVGARRSSVVEYLGIPYAEPPVGTLRFRPPVPKRPWQPSVLVTKSFSPECLQSALFFVDDTVRDEDCLYLNIWRPKGVISAKLLLPVLVWIYGGAFVHGGTAKREYNGRFLAEKGVVVVTLNYRVGALGFLVSVDDGLFGNYGLGDQKVAMNWISSNIQNFGGDPSRITLFGESAGAMSIVQHLLDVSRHKETINAVIMQSNPLGYR